jgi:hypothetical protein
MEKFPLLRTPGQTSATLSKKDAIKRLRCAIILRSLADLSVARTLTLISKALLSKLKRMLFKLLKRIS